MKAILILVAIVLVLVLIGWVSFGTTENGASISVDTDRMQQDTGEAIESGGELIENTREEIREERREHERDSAIDAEPVEGGAADLPPRLERTPEPAGI